MSFHLEGPWLSTTGKSKSKRKFRNAEEAKRHRELQDSWNKLSNKWNSTAVQTKNSIKSTVKYTLSIPEGRGTAHIKSRGDGIGVAAAQESKKYTGKKIIGLASMHKSNCVPVFSKSEAEDISKMRR